MDASNYDSRGFVIEDSGHRYLLCNVDGGEPQRLLFIKKELAEGEPAGTLETVQNGTTNEAVLGAVLNRLEFLNAKLPDDDNVIAINALHEALNALERRTQARKARGVEGTHKA